MMTREPKSAWVTGKLTGPDRAALERIAAERFEGNVSAALRYCVRKATGGTAPQAREIRGAAVTP